MSHEPLDTVPACLIAGDSLLLRWEVQSEYPIADYALSFTLYGPAQLVLTADESEGDYRVTLSKSASAALAPGTYKWVARVESDDHRHTVATGSIKVTANPADLTGETEARSWARQALEALETALLAQPLTTSFSVFSRSYQFQSHAELIRYREYLREEVRREEDAERMAHGGRSRSTAWVRF